MIRCGEMSFVILQMWGRSLVVVGRRSVLNIIVFESRNNTPDEISGANNAVSCYKDAVQFSASFVIRLRSLVFDEI